MHTWAKRGLQTALVTGGLLMLGTGIASAQDNVNPDAPPNPLDAKVRIPVDVDQNTLGTPVGAHDLPEIHREISTPTATGLLPGRLAEPANPLVRNAREGLRSVDTSHITRGNTADADVVVPVSACGNAIAAGGDAYIDRDCSRSVTEAGDVKADGSYGTLAGNVAHAAAAVSPQADGNAVAALANAESRGSSEQRAVAGGDVKTSGQDGSLSGNIAAVQGALPVQVTDNAVAAGGNSHTDASTSNSTAAGGSLSTTGDRSTGGGNVLGTPLATIVAVSGNGVAAAGTADTLAENRASSDAGDTRVNSYGTPMWSTTSGDASTLAGNTVQPAFAGPVATGDNALTGGGLTRVDNSMEHTAEAGGNSSTSGQDSVLSGNFADAPVALPVSNAGNATSGVGTTSARHSNEATATAGGDTFTHGDRSVLSSNGAHLPPAGAVDLCGNGTTAGGIAEGGCNNDVVADSGGYNGTTGNDAVGSGNVGQVPIGAPAEAFGNGVGAVGTPSGRATEHKVIRSGRVPTSIDDNGTVSSNVVSTPTALGGQVFGNSTGAVANPTSRSDSDTTIDLGNPPSANGRHGSASGNVVHVPTSNPAQVFGGSVVGVGNSVAAANSRMDSRSGGATMTNGDEGSFSGNVVSLPESSSPQVFGSAVGAGGNARSDSGNDFLSRAGGDVQTSGDDGSFSGNGVGAQPAVPLQVFGDAVSVAGNGSSRTTNKSGLVAGGRHLTSADDSAWSGNLVTAPAGVSPAVHGDAVSVGGLADTATGSNASSRSGGETTTSGYGAVSARDFEAPTEAFARLFGIPLDVLGTATANTQDRNDVRTGSDKGDAPVGDATRGIELPASVDSLMGATELPSLAMLRDLPGYLLPLNTPRLGGLHGLPVTGAADVDPASRAALPPTSGIALPAVPDLDGATTVLPKVELPTEQLPAVPGVDALAPVTNQLRVGETDPLGWFEQAQHVLPSIADRLLGGTTRELPVVSGATRELPVVSGATRELPVVSGATRELPVVSGATRELPVVSDADADERSFGGTLPLVGTVPVDGTLPVVGRFGPLPDLQRLPLKSVPAAHQVARGLSVAIPAALPFVLPVPGVAQPRTAAPAVPPMALTGLNLNPTQGIRANEIADRTQAPALAGIDARSVFNSLEDTTVMPRI
ncbi:hypothetical protein F4560_006507 [Saccharothrix ecbatanensis]|uniref:Small secreted domain DUF320 n=1 Tax=Saccharothrix ecbatanensis TaxID=1105145 RepID=A0A7W9HRQ9_9PSEU|nr:hypothetical protein [Saccharothrix ecbatanensis]MBB5806739.1 hypothetical protein [Saccharothrix ecbatanensis]